MSKRHKPAEEKRTQQDAGAEGGACCQGFGALLEPRFFKALCDPNRIAILARLASRDAACCVSEVNECCPVDISVVSRHLAILRDAGIVRAEKRGKHVHYSVCYAEIVDTLRKIADAIEACCPAGARTTAGTVDTEERDRKQDEGNGKRGRLMAEG